MATAIRFLTYSSCGALVGWFANEHRRHLEQLREFATRDFLTGLLNTRVFDEALARRCQTGRPFVLLLGDMDNLKEVNARTGTRLETPSCGALRTNCPARSAPTTNSRALEATSSPS